MVKRSFLPRTVASAVLVGLAAAAAAVLGAGVAAAHCCHDEREVLVQAQSEFRRGLHDADEDRAGGRLGSRPPEVGRGLGDSSGSLRDGGLGGLRGNSLGNYGAGSIGERGPGGLGALRGGAAEAEPPRPR